ncbi:MAG: helix-turn-helix domain-containing protein [Alphaproteobacteria bacterium]|jgi:DNA-binding transcriptional regulator YiaG|nr:helix-turn-helix domain-containing protein [Alphaproteobacteria bacterium]
MKPEEILALRKRTGLSQERFSEKVGVSTRTIHMWELGKNKPNQLSWRALQALDFETKERELVDEKK